MKLLNKLALAIFCILVLTVIALAQDAVTFDAKQAIDQGKLSRDRGGIKIESTDYLIDWDMEVTGYSPHSGKFVLEGKNIRSKKSDKNVDIIIVSPIIFKEGSKASIFEDVEEITSINHNFTCDSPDYGWTDAEKTGFYCTKNSDVQNNDTKEITTTSSKEFIKLPADSSSEIRGNELRWAIKDTKTVRKQKDVSAEFTYVNGNTPYGNNLYVVKNVSFKAGKDYKLLFEIDVDKEILPIKYTVCIANIAENKFYFCLDPTIINARTWTTESDFTNNTIRSNISVENGTLSIPKGLKINYNATTSICSLYIGNCGLENDNNYGSHTYIMQDGNYCGHTGNVLQNFTISNYFPDRVNVTLYYKAGIKGYSISGITAVNCFNFSDYSWIKIDEMFDEDGNDNTYSTMTREVPIPQNCLNNSAGLLINFDMAGLGSSYPNYCETNLLDTEIRYRYNHTSASYYDRIGWSPATGNNLKNISINLVTTGTQLVKFFYNSSNSSLDTSQGITLSSNGTNVVNLNLGVNEKLYYGFTFTDLTENVTPQITSYTLYENVVNVNTTTMAQSAILDGILFSSLSSGITSYSNQKVYLRNLQNSQALGTADIVAVYGNQRWIFNYITQGKTSYGFFNITPVVYTLEMSNKTYAQISNMVKALIDSTKN